MRKLIGALLVAVFVFAGASVAQAKKPAPSTVSVTVLCFHYGDQLQYQAPALVTTDQAAVLLATQPGVYTAGYCPTVLPTLN